MIATLWKSAQCMPCRLNCGLVDASKKSRGKCSCTQVQGGNIINLLKQQLTLSSAWNNSLFFVIWRVKQGCMSVQMFVTTLVPPCVYLNRSLSSIAILERPHRCRKSSVSFSLRKYKYGRLRSNQARAMSTWRSCVVHALNRLKLCATTCNTANLCHASRLLLVRHIISNIHCITAV